MGEAMRNIKLIIEYEGSAYHGWQSQINAVAIQDVVEKALVRLTGEECKLTGASRTDVGVHAFGQVANFYTASAIPPEKFSFALNTLLPPDITIKRSEEVSQDFHSRYCSKGKVYKYLIYNSKLPSALLRNRAWQVPYNLDFLSMENTCSLFKGKHDFSAFYRATGSKVLTTVRTLTKVNLTAGAPLLQAGVLKPGEGQLLELEIAGDGFLYNMVRIIAGTLIEVGIGRLKHEEVAQLLDRGERQKAGRTASALGLYLVEVFY
jgi:tRNA pseudouridine38-40 synthase